MLLHSHAAHSILNKDSIKSALEGITFSCMDPKLTRKSLCFKINVFFFFSPQKWNMQQLFAEDLFIYVYGTQQVYGMVGVALQRYLESPFKAGHHQQKDRAGKRGRKEYD